MTDKEAWTASNHSAGGMANCRQHFYV